jgi:hypothetical protein
MIQFKSVLIAAWQAGKAVSNSTPEPVGEICLMNFYWRWCVTGPGKL